MAYDGVCTVFGVVFGGKPEVNGVGTGDKFTVFFGYYRHIEISLQNSPCGIGLGFEESYVDKDGVVNLIVFYERGCDSVHVFIAGVKVADLTGGEDVFPLQGEAEDGGLNEGQDGYNQPEAFFVERFLAEPSGGMLAFIPRRGERGFRRIQRIILSTVSQIAVAVWSVVVVTLT